MNKDTIDQVVIHFYNLAKNDILIGYHFRHIKDFDSHIPKIQRFWYLVLLDLSSEEKKLIINKGVPKNIIQSHEYLKIKVGELNRWILLFHQTLEFYQDESPEFINTWKSEIDKFKKIFLNSKTLFH